MTVNQRPGTNALQTAEEVLALMEELSKDFPQGLAYDVIYNPTEFIEASIDAVVHTMLEAVLLVVAVVLLFLGTWRAAITPILAIPVSCWPSASWLMTRSSLWRGSKSISVTVSPRVMRPSRP